ncbi:UNKNOWN [Stylonychia lemnae]|uniref:Uncharacterized protein n=1 Tax=Stylonychia lemnae TaxID=5949 RepID=A0A078AVA4_STYLE|nr:UNKNOWN [Stylonychia lemnae]|eukprot:CDW85951.1 UNKNOWN [Stylonychia lemnae]
MKAEMNKKSKEVIGGANKQITREEQNEKVSIIIQDQNEQENNLQQQEPLTQEMNENECTDIPLQQQLQTILDISEEIEEAFFKDVPPQDPQFLIVEAQNMIKNTSIKENPSFKSQFLNNLQVQGGVIKHQVSQVVTKETTNSESSMQIQESQINSARNITKASQPNVLNRKQSKSRNHFLTRTQSQREILLSKTSSNFQSPLSSHNIKVDEAKNLKFQRTTSKLDKSSQKEKMSKTHNNSKFLIHNINHQNFMIIAPQYHIKQNQDSKTKLQNFKDYSPEKKTYGQDPYQSQELNQILKKYFNLNLNTQQQIQSRLPKGIIFNRNRPLIKKIVKNNQQQQLNSTQDQEQESLSSPDLIDKSKERLLKDMQTTKKSSIRRKFQNSIFKRSQSQNQIIESESKKLESPKIIKDEEQQMLLHKNLTQKFLDSQKLKYLQKRIQSSNMTRNVSNQSGIPSSENETENLSSQNLQLNSSQQLRLSNNSDKNIKPTSNNQSDTTQYYMEGNNMKSVDRL